jgi:hypothetical protein
LEEGGALEKEQLFSVDDEPWMAAYFGDYAINPGCSVLLKSRAIPYGMRPIYLLDGPNPTGHAVWGYLDYGDWGITTFCFAPRAGD